MRPIRNALLAILGVLAILASRAIAQQPAPGIWDEAIMAEPFETRPFRSIKIPKWVQETVGCGYTLSVMDAKGRAEAASHGVSISEMGFVNPFFACYESKLLKTRSPDFPPGR